MLSTTRCYIVQIHPTAAWRIEEKSLRASQRTPRPCRAFGAARQQEEEGLDGKRMKASRCLQAVFKVMCHLYHTHFHFPVVCCLLAKVFQARLERKKSAQVNGTHSQPALYSDSSLQSKACFVHGGRAPASRKPSWQRQSGTGMLNKGAMCTSP